MYYQLSETLKTATFDTCMTENKPFVAVLKPEEWLSLQNVIEMGIDIDFNFQSPRSTKAETNLDSLTATFLIPNRKDLLESTVSFSFALNKKGIFFIDSKQHVEKLLNKIQKSKKWKQASLERFLYDFLELIIDGDLELLEGYDKELDAMEELFLEGKSDRNSEQYLNQLRRKLTKLNLHYSQLIDLAQELSENENNFFKEENLRFFRLFSARVSRLQTIVISLRETILRIRELSNSQLEMRQNKIMATLTIVTTCCMPLTILVGWYGMNFKYMPELNSPWGYPSLIIIAITLLTSSILYVKFKKWL
ncbi:magnesium transporter CorA [Streptococcus didelphis]|uniref:Magnesium transporter CorA n=1 Tax=Streptococcus didelphis TaxID=102886 RepID=A0ABY9LJ38_9STRE|nr:CorA family divalent cation transporter [Streptococcus didelphis]WMB28839.1 magnesium transporter CorA [Streptococcus didelphis]WMB30169.1 magnesium transporter CorA [Streptococcus didelphis]